MRQDKEGRQWIVEQLDGLIGDRWVTSGPFGRLQLQQLHLQANKRCQVRDRLLRKLEKRQAFKMAVQNIKA